MEVSVGLMAHVQPPLIYFLGSDKGSAKKFGRATTIVTLPKAVAERSASEQRKRKNESLVTSGGRKCFAKVPQVLLVVCAGDVRV